MTTPPPYLRDFRAVLTRPHDGDTFRMLVDTSFDGRQEPRLRLLDTGAPELLRRLMVPLSVAQPGGPETREFVSNWFKFHAMRLSDRRWPFWILTAMTKTKEPDERTTFRRYLAVVYPYDRRGPNDSLNEAVLQFVIDNKYPTGD